MGVEIGLFFPSCLNKSLLFSDHQEGPLRKMVMSLKNEAVGKLQGVNGPGVDKVDHSGGCRCLEGVGWGPKTEFLV